MSFFLINFLVNFIINIFFATFFVITVAVFFAITLVIIIFFLVAFITSLRVNHFAFRPFHRRGNPNHFNTAYLLRQHDCFQR